MNVNITNIILKHLNPDHVGRIKTSLRKNTIKEKKKVLMKGRETNKN